MTDKPALSPEALQLLERMHDIHEPAPVSWWPLAPGWWVLGGVSVALLGLLIYWLIRRVKQNRYRQEALSLLDNIATEPAGHSIADLNAVLKRTALYAYPNERPEIARGYGEPWIQWLNDKCDKPPIDGAAAHALAQGEYNPNTDNVPLDELLLAARQWVKRHAPVKTQRGRPHA